jgi:hypothetical protein
MVCCGMKWCDDLNNERLVGAVLPVNSVGPQYQKIYTDFIHSSRHVPKYEENCLIRVDDHEMRR